MSSYLTFTSPTIDDPQRRSTALLETDEFQYLAMSLAQRVKEGSMPPDDAYWWTRTLCAEPYLRDHPDVGASSLSQIYAGSQCRVA